MIEPYGSNRNVAILSESIETTKYYDEIERLEKIFNSLNPENKNHINEKYTNRINGLMGGLDECITLINELKKEPQSKELVKYKLNIHINRFNKFIDNINSLLLLPYEYINTNTNKNKKSLKYNISLLLNKIK